MTRGQLAEWLAAAILTVAGYRIIKRNFSAPTGEIDIIAQKRSLLAFVEVRLRRGRSRVTGLESVDAAKQQRLIRTSQAFVQRYASYQNHKLRFDVLSFGLRDYRPHRGLTFRWTRNAFTPEQLP